MNEREREAALQKLGVSRSYLSRFCGWLARQGLLLSLLATALVSLCCAFSGEMGLLPCMSMWAVLIAVSVVSFGVLAVSLICCTPLPVLCNMECLGPAARVGLCLTALGACAVLPLGSAAVVVLAGSTLEGASLNDLRLQCSPENTGGACWEHRCSGVTRVFLSEGQVLEEYASVVPVGPYRLRVSPISAHKGSPLDSQIGREEVAAYAVQWWSAEALDQTEASCNRTEGGLCGTLLWGNIGPMVRGLKGAFPRHDVRPILILGDPDQFLESGRPYLLVGCALLLAHAALTILLILCTESRRLRRGDWRSGGYGRLGAFPSPPSAEVVLI